MGLQKHYLTFYFFAFVGTILGIIALIFSVEKRKTGPRGIQGVTGAVGPVGGQGLPILQSDPIILSGDQILTLGSVPIPLFKIQDMGFVFLGLVMEVINPNASLSFSSNLAIISGPSAPVQTVASFPGTQLALNQVPTFQMTFGATALSAARPGNQMYMLRTQDGSDPTGGGTSTTMTFRVLYTTMPADPNAVDNIVNSH